MSRSSESSLVPSIASRLLRWAVVYLLAGLGLGLYMAIGHERHLMSVHAHVNLLGWSSLGLCGLTYAAFPHLADSRLAGIHAWLHLLGLPVMMLSVGALAHGAQAAAAGAGVGALVVIAGLACFSINVLRGTRR